jgi:hypothetical protein
MHSTERGCHRPLMRVLIEVAPGGPLEAHLRHLLRVARREKTPPVSGRDGAQTLAATFAAHRSTKAGLPMRPVELLGECR